MTWSPGILGSTDKGNSGVPELSQLLQLLVEPFVCCNSMVNHGLGVVGRWDGGGPRHGY